MSSLYLHIETIFDEPDLVVLRTSMTLQDSPVVMLVRLDALGDAVLTMLDGLNVTEDTPSSTVGKRTKKGGQS
ncbi:hypothetical protein [Burkholderia vietnamiensis]|uniref:hypothetical protein n=1 Tax=Burkholderia vietnamiensis TaxID=60552 RepID=UPI001CF45240|nr:hypothetical protein [Burkholderia vietnamiensis]MCA8199197.1 hypothetical protein [Burkholderia vietnamiensis]